MIDALINKVFSLINLENLSQQISLVIKTITYCIVFMIGICIVDLVKFQHSKIDVLLLLFLLV